MTMIDIIALNRGENNVLVNAATQTLTVREIRASTARRLIYCSGRIINKPINVSQRYFFTGKLIPDKKN